MCTWCLLVQHVFCMWLYCTSAYTIRASSRCILQCLTMPFANASENLQSRSWAWQEENPHSWAWQDKIRLQVLTSSLLFRTWLECGCRNLAWHCYEPAAGKLKERTQAWRVHSLVLNLCHLRDYSHASVSIWPMHMYRLLGNLPLCWQHCWTKFSCDKLLRHL